MDYQLAMEIITRVESEFEVNALKYGNLKVWPLIRLAIWQQICHPENKFMAKNKWLVQLKSYLRSVKQQARNLTQAYSQSYKNFQLNQRSPVDVIFFSRVEDHADFLDGKYINRHIDPLIQLAETIPNLNYLKLELLTNRANQTVPRFQKTQFLDLFLQKPQNSPAKNKINNFQKLRELCLEISSINLQETYFIKQSQAINQYEIFFEDYLHLLKPRQVLLVCYYYLHSMALISACKKLNIKTIDIQHGKQGKYHGMYTHWTKIPQEGYELLPDYFWSWGEESKKNIVKWYPEGCCHHQPIIGGNCWLGNWINGEGYSLGSEIEKFICELEKYNKVILTTLQPFHKLSEIIPNCLIEAMSQSPDNWIWLNRLHPHQKPRLREIRDYLNQHKIKNFELTQATHIPLYVLLKHCQNHITCWSSVCYEALLFGVPTTIIHPTGLELYDQYIKEDKFHYAVNATELLNSLAKNVNLNTLKEEVPYIETDLQVAEIALKYLLS